MPRTSRMIITDEKAIYHVMSRTALDGFPLMDVEKDFLLDLIRRLSKLYLVEIVGLLHNGKPFSSSDDITAAVIFGATGLSVSLLKTERP